MTKKVIILGTPYAGKTTLCRALRKQVASCPILELDEELSKQNHNKWPANYNFRNRVVLPRVLTRVMTMPNVIFFTSGFDLELLKKAKKKHFKIIQLFLYKKQAEQRMKKHQKERIRNFHLNAEHQKIIKNLGLVDVRINSFGPIEKVLQRLQNALR